MLTSCANCAIRGIVAAVRSLPPLDPHPRVSRASHALGGVVAGGGGVLQPAHGALPVLVDASALDVAALVAIESKV